MSTAVQNFGGLRVASFESRNADEMRRMLERAGAAAFVSPSMREVPLDAGSNAAAFATGLIGGEFDLVILMTGVGLRQLLKAIEGQVDRDAFLEALGKVTTVARGPKPVAVLRELKMKPTHVVPEPNTWRELLSTLDAKTPVGGLRVGLMEYGISNARLVSGLTERGAQVTSVRIYRWDLPEDTGPLIANIERIVAGEIDVLMFTSSPQVLNLVGVAEQQGQLEALRAATQSTVIASVGPSTSETLRDHGFEVDLEPDHPKMGHLVNAAAARSRAIWEEKRSAGSGTITPLGSSPLAASTVASTGASASASAAADRMADPAYNSLFLKACRREPTERTPVWLMRQAGRYMSEYRAVRSQVSFLELCYNPALCAEVMITAVKKIGVDAAIIFADLLPILEPMGLNLEFVADEGPQIHNPIRTAADLERFHELEDLSPLAFVSETVRLTKAGLPGIPVIGFAGAPFTLASYAIEGSGSRNYIHTKSLMYRDRGAWDELLGRLARSVARYLNAQIAAGAHAVQIFDSWVGCLGVDDYRSYVLPHVRTLIQSITPGVPVIHFGAGNPALLPSIAEAGGDVLGIDWRVPLDAAWQTVGYDRAVQGNLDPGVLFATPEEIEARAHGVLRQVAGRPGHIFNLGHGILPQTPVEHVQRLVQAVQEFRHGG